MKPNEVDKYLKQFDDEVLIRLGTVRKIIKDLIPSAEEVINYGIPTFKLNGKNLVHYAGYKNHIGFYPTPSVIKHFGQELANFKTSKGAVQFLHNKPLPKKLIKQMVEFRLQTIV